MVEVVLVCRNSGGVAVDFAYGDLAGVEAVSVLVRARNPLRSDGRGVFVRSPPGLLTRMLDLFGLTDMIERPGAQNNGSSSS